MEQQYHPFKYYLYYILYHSLNATASNSQIIDSASDIENSDDKNDEKGANTFPIFAYLDNMKLDYRYDNL